MPALGDDVCRMPSTSTVWPPRRILEVGFEGDLRDDVLAARDAAEDAAGVVRQETLRVIWSRCCVPFCATQANPAPISTPLAALMLISAWAISASRRSKIGSPQPGGIPLPRPTPRHRPNPRLAQIVHVLLEFGDLFIRPEERVGSTGSQENRPPDRPERRQVSAHLDAEALAQILLAIAPAATRIAVSGPTNDPAAVIPDAVFLVVGVIRVARPELLRNRRSPGALVLVEDHQPDRRPRGLALEYAGQYLHLIRFAALGGVARRARTTAVQVGLDIRLDSAMPGGQPSTMQPIAIPWLSPNEVTVKSFPMVFPDMAAILTAGPPCAHAHREKNSTALARMANTVPEGDGQPAGASRKTVSRSAILIPCPASIGDIPVFAPTAPRVGAANARPTMRTLCSYSPASAAITDD